MKPIEEAIVDKLEANGIVEKVTHSDWGGGGGGIPDMQGLKSNYTQTLK